MEKHLVMASILFEKHGTRTKKDAPLDPTRGSGAQLFLRARARFQAKDDLRIGPRIVHALSSIASKNLVLRENNRLR